MKDNNKIIIYGTYDNLEGFWVEARYIVINKINPEKDIQENMRAIIDLAMESKWVDSLHANDSKELKANIKLLQDKWDIHKNSIICHDDYFLKTYITDYNEMYRVNCNNTDKTRLEYGLELLGQDIKLYKNGLLSLKELKEFKNGIFEQLFDITEYNTRNIDQKY